MKKMHTGLMSAAALLLSAAALAAPQGTSGSSGGSMGGSPSGSAPQGADSGSASMRGSSGSGSEQLASADRKFVLEAASAGMFEVQAAQLAQTKAQDSAAKSYAKQMIQDHEKNNRQLMQIAQSKGITPPTRLEAKHQSMLTKLQKADGDEFDEQYGKIMDQSHRDTVQLFERGQKQVQDMELKSYISQTLPTLHRHHEQAASLPGGKGASSRQAEAADSSSSSGSRSDTSDSRESSSGMGDSPSGAGGMSGSSGGAGGMGGSSTGSGSMGGSSGGTSGSGSSSSSSPGSSSASGTGTRPPGSSSANSDTGSTGRP
jgi:putative membrane protein